MLATESIAISQASNAIDVHHNQGVSQMKNIFSSTAFKETSMLRNLARGFAVFCAASLLMFTASPLLAQEWSAPQKEVWKNVEAYWALDAAGNTEGFLSYFHTDYMGWDNGRAVPGGKDVARKFITHLSPCFIRMSVQRPELSFSFPASSLVICT